MKHLAALKALVGEEVSIENKANRDLEGPVQFWLCGKLEGQEDEGENDHFYVRVGEHFLGSVGVSFAPSHVSDLRFGVHGVTIVLK